MHSHIYTYWQVSSEGLSRIKPAEGLGRKGCTLLRSRLAAESFQLQNLHRSLLESRQQQQQLQQQQQQQLQQQQQFIEQQQHAFAQRQLQAESEVATRQLELEQA